MSSYPEFPTKEDWTRIYNASQFENIFSLLDRFDELIPTSNDLLDLPTTIELQSLVPEITHRLGDTGKSYLLMMFYYEQGIPDDPAFISPGMQGQTVQFYPNMDFKLFSAWDLIGHFLNVKYGLGVEKVDFNKAVTNLKSKNVGPFKNLGKLKSSPAFKTASILRNNITHNRLPNTLGMEVTRKVTRIGPAIDIGLKIYFPAAEIVANTRETLSLFASTIEAMLDQS